MTIKTMLAALRSWKMIAGLLCVAVLSSMGTSTIMLWLNAGAPARLLVEKSEMSAVRGGQILTVAVLRDLRRTDCTTTTTRWLSRDITYALTPEMRAMAPQLPAIVHTQMTYPLNSQPVPRVTPGMQVSLFGLVIPNVPAGHYQYHATMHTACPLVFSRESTIEAPIVTFDVLPPAP